MDNPSKKNDPKMKTRSGEDATAMMDLSYQQQPR